MPKGKPIQFFVSNEWHEMLAREAILNNTSLSAYVRSHLPGKSEVDAVRSMPKNLQLAQTYSILVGLREELKRIGNNINQSAMVLNSHARYNGQLPTQLDVREDLANLEQAINRLSREIRSIGQELTRG